MTSPTRKLIVEVEKLRPQHVELMERVLRSDSNNVYLQDHFALAVANRSMSLIDGFSLMIHHDVFMCAAGLLRMQLDNLSRWNSVFLVRYLQKVCKQSGGVPSL